MTSDQHTGSERERGFTEPEGYAASLRQQAKWIEASRRGEMDSNDIDVDEINAAADYIESRLAQGVDTTDLWAAVRQRDANINSFFDAIKTEESYLLKHFDADCGIMPGDVEGSFHRLREVFYRTTGSQERTPAECAPVTREEIALAIGNQIREGAGLKPIPYINDANRELWDRELEAADVILSKFKVTKP